jgi:hypothetical protein
MRRQADAQKIAGGAGQLCPTWLDFFRLCFLHPILTSVPPISKATKPKEVKAQKVKAQKVEAQKVMSHVDLGVKWFGKRQKGPPKITANYKKLQNGTGR